MLTWKWFVVLLICSQQQPCRPTCAFIAPHHARATVRTPHRSVMSSLQVSSSSTSPPTESAAADKWEQEAERLKEAIVDPWYRKFPMRPFTVDTAKEYRNPEDEEEDFGAVFPGPHSYLGGARDDRDGCIYGIPSHTPSVVCLCPDATNGEYKAITIPLPPSAANGGGKFKWLRGILAQGYLYGIPANYDFVLQVDVDAYWNRRPATGEIVKLLPLPDSHIPGKPWQWHGAAMNAEKTAIYCIPSNALHVLKVDLATFATSFIDIDIPADKYPNMDITRTNKWYGGILGDDNAVYGVCYAACSVLRISCEDDTATLVGPDFGCGMYNWHGGVKVKGSIYAFPCHANTFLKIDTTFVSKGQNCTQLSIHRAPDDMDTRGRYQWLGGGIGADGNVYAMPSDASTILCVRVETDHCFTFGFVGSEKNKYQGATLGRDGCLYAIPANGRKLLRIDTRPSTLREKEYQLLGNLPNRKDKYQGGFIGNDGMMYSIPECAYRILKISIPEREGLQDDVQIKML